MSRLRVAVVGTRGIPGVHGGVERHCEELYPRLVKLGAEVTVYARDAYVAAEMEWRGVRVVPLPSSHGKSTEAMTHTIRAVIRARSERPDVLHFHSVGPAGVLPLARALGLRTVVTIHAFDHMQSKWGHVAKSYLKYGLWAGAKTADQCIVVADWMASALDSRYGCAHMHSIPNGPLTLRKADGASFVKAHGIVPGEYALFVGRLIPDKRVEDLLVATSHEPQIPLAVVGGSSHTDVYAKELTRVAGDHVRMLGYRYGVELEELYTHAGVFALPSQVEGLPLSLLEAMSIGVPCVAADIPGNREVLGSLGHLYPVGDVQALRGALHDALRLSPERRCELANDAMKRVAECYCWDAIAERTMSVMHLAAQGRPRAASHSS